MAGEGYAALSCCVRRHQQRLHIRRGVQLLPRRHCLRTPHTPRNRPASPTGTGARNGPGARNRPGARNGPGGRSGAGGGGGERCELRGQPRRDLNAPHVRCVRGADGQPQRLAPTGMVARPPTGIGTHPAVARPRTGIGARPPTCIGACPAAAVRAPFAGIPGAARAWACGGWEAAGAPRPAAGVLLMKRRERERVHAAANVNRPEPEADHPSAPLRYRPQRVQLGAVPLATDGQHAAARVECHRQNVTPREDAAGQPQRAGGGAFAGMGRRGPLAGMRGRRRRRGGGVRAQAPIIGRLLSAAGGGRLRLRGDVRRRSGWW
mmetsp:Transcript_29951/g.96645  ORF Transcript_29951/g.96645 Transcript_29951/m.96645 type:complete len:321 (-) Transcript_29951:1541-2503(-)